MSKANDLASLIADGVIGTAELDTGAITLAKLSDNAVNADKLDETDSYIIAGLDVSGGQIHDVSSIYRGASATTQGGIGLGTDGSVRFMNADAEGARFNGEGRLGLGTQQPLGIIDIEDSVSPMIRMSYGGATADHKVAWDSAGMVIAADTGATSELSYISMQVFGSERLRITHTGDVNVGRNVKMGGALDVGTQSQLNVLTNTQDFLMGNGVLGPFLANDAAVDLGRYNGRFKDLWLSGTANVGTKVHITGGVLELGDEAVSSGYINADESMYFNIDSNNTPETTQFVWGKGRTGLSGGTELMRLTTDGKLGVGRVTPAAKLHIQDPDAVLRLNKTATDTDGIITMGFWDDTTNRIEGAHKPMFITNYYQPLHIGYNNTRVVTIDTTEKVGVGTQFPSNKLTVVGSPGQANGIASFDGSVFTRIYGDTAFSSANLNWTTGNALRFSTSADNFAGFTEHARIDSSGNFGIGTQNPLSKLHVSSDNNTEIRINTTNPGATPRVRISYNDSNSASASMSYNPNTAEFYIDNTYPRNEGTVYGDLVFRISNAGTMSQKMRISADTGSPTFYTSSGSYAPNLNYGLKFHDGAGIATWNFNPAGSGSYKNLSFWATGWNGSSVVQRSILTIGNYDGYVGIGDTDKGRNPSSALHIKMHENKNAQITLEGTSTTNKNGVFWVDENGVDQSSFYYDHGTNLHNLVVNGNGLHFYSRQTNSTIAYIGGSSGAGGYNNSYFAGKVGIGGAVPQDDATLQVGGSEPVLAIRNTVTENATKSATLELLEHGAGSKFGGYWKYDGNLNWNYIGGIESNGYNNVIQYPRGGSVLQLNAAGAQQVYITADKTWISNSVSIGLSTPSSRLDVQEPWDSGRAALTIRDNSTTSNVDIPPIDFSHSGDRVRARIQAVNAGAYGDKAIVFSNYDASSWNDTSDKLIERMRIHHTGNVGIGTTGAPAEKLEVLGNIRISRTATYNAYWNQFISHANTSEYGTLYFQGDTSTGGIIFRTGGVTTKPVTFEADGDVHITGSGSTMAATNLGNATLKIGGTRSAPGLGLDSNEIIFGNDAYIGTATAQDILFRTNGANNRLRITSDDHVIFGAGLDADPGNGNTNTGVAVRSVNSGTSVMLSASRTSGNALRVNRNTTPGEAVFFGYNGVTEGSISVDTTGTTYNTTSDRRLKDNIVAITDGKKKLLAMNPVTHTWKADPDAPAIHGFIAQEMQEVVPEAVTGDPDGEAMMSMDYGRITPVIVAALQDALKEIEELKTRIAQLEAK